MDPLVRKLHQQFYACCVGFPLQMWLYLRMTSAQTPHHSGMAVAGAVDFLTAPEVARVLRIKPWAVVRLCREKKLTATKPGQQWLITPADLQAYIDAGRNTDEQVSA